MFKRLGVFAWVIIVVNLLFLAWLIAGISGGANEASKLTDDASKAGAEIGTAIGAGLVIALWAFVDVILGVLFLVTRSRRTRHDIYEEA